MSRFDWTKTEYSQHPVAAWKTIYQILTHGAKNLRKTDLPLVFSSKLSAVNCRTSAATGKVRREAVKNRNCRLIFVASSHFCRKVRKGLGRKHNRIDLERLSLMSFSKGRRRSTCTTHTPVTSSCSFDLGVGGTVTKDWLFHVLRHE